MAKKLFDNKRMIEGFCFDYSRHLIIDMDRICRIWEIELQTVIEIHKIGHRKRMLHSVGLPICKKKDDKKNQIHIQDSNGGGDGKSATNKNDEIISKTSEQNNQTNGHKMNHGKNRLLNYNSYKSKRSSVIRYFFSLSSDLLHNRQIYQPI